MLSVLLRVASCLPLHTFWPDLAQFCLVLLGDICDIIPVNRHLSFCSILGMLGLKCNITRQQEDISHVSEYTFHPLFPFAEYSVALKETMVGRAPALHYAEFVNERIATFGVAGRQERLLCYLHDFSQCALRVINKLEGKPEQIVAFLNLLILSNPFCIGDDRWLVLSYLIQNTVNATEMPYETMAVVFDFCCSRMIEGRFSRSPTLILSPILTAYQRFGKQISQKLLLAIEVSIYMITRMEVRDVRMSLLSLLILHKDARVPRIDVDFAVGLLECIVRISQTDNLHEECVHVLEIVWQWFSKFKANQDHLEIQAWVNAMHHAKAFVTMETEQIVDAKTRLVNREREAMERSLEEIRVRNSETQPVLLEQCSHFCGQLQSEGFVWQLELQNQRKLLEESLQFDASAWHRIREKANVFSKFVDFRGCAQTSNIMNQRLFRFVFKLDRQDWIIPVSVQISGTIGKCLLGTKDDGYYLIDELDKEFRPIENSEEFERSLKDAIIKCYQYDGHALIPVRLSRLQIVDGAHDAILFAFRSDLQMRISAEEPNDPNFASVLAKVGSK
jgi:hypothetical protein